MHRKGPSQKVMRSLCAEVHEDDGLDPRELFRSQQEDRTKPNRKARQLCRQVAEVLGLVLAEQSDDLLRGLTVAAVAPAPDTSRLRVTLVDSPPDDGPDRRDRVLRRLASATGSLRTELAAAITRRRAPMLVFQVVGPNDMREVER